MSDFMRPRRGSSRFCRMPRKKSSSGNAVSRNVMSSAPRMVTDGRQARLETDEVSGEAYPEGEGHEKEPFAEADLKVVECGNEGVTDAIEAAYHYIEIEGDVAEVELGEAAESGIGPSSGEDAQLEDEGDAEEGDEVLPGEVRWEIGKFDEGGERDGKKGESGEVGPVEFVAGDGEEEIGEGEEGGEEDAGLGGEEERELRSRCTGLEARTHICIGEERELRSRSTGEGACAHTVRGLGEAEEPEDGE